MKIQELIRGILDMIDGVEHHATEPQSQVIVVAKPDPAGEMSPLSHAGDDINRFRQIVDLADTPDPCATFANEPNEKYADIEAVTTHAGGGLNGPKHPADIKSNSISMYPNALWKGE